MQSPTVQLPASAAFRLDDDDDATKVDKATTIVVTQTRREIILKHVRPS